MTTPKAVPTATGIQPIRRRRVFPVHPESPSILDFETTITLLHLEGGDDWTDEDWLTDDN